MTLDTSLPTILSFHLRAQRARAHHPDMTEHTGTVDLYRTVSSYDSIHHLFLQIRLSLDNKQACMLLLG